MKTQAPKQAQPSQAAGLARTTRQPQANSVQTSDSGVRDGANKAVQSGHDFSQMAVTVQTKRKSGGSASLATSDPAVLEQVQKDGQALEPATRDFMEPRFGHDFSRVRVHTDASAAETAQSLRARAYTVGSHIVFGVGEYAPATPDGTRLLAHELAHTIQQSGSANRQPLTKLKVSQPGEPLEAEAERAAQAIGSGGSPQAVAASLHSSGVMAARDPKTDEPLTEEKIIEQAGKDAQAATPGAAGLPGTQVPFTDTGWKGDEIIKTGQIEPASAIGKAVLEGPAAVNLLVNAAEAKLSDKVVELSKTDKKDLATGTAYFNAVLEATNTCSAFKNSIGEKSVTYGELRDFARLNSRLDSSGRRRQLLLIAWAAEETPADGMVGGPTPSLREEIVKTLKKWKGAAEGDKGLFDNQFMTPAAIDDQRKASSKEGRTFTTCINFMGFALKTSVDNSAVTQAGRVNADVADPEKRKGLHLPEGAWHNAKANMTDRPKPGDIYVLTFAADVVENGELKFGKGWFSHMGFILSMTKNEVKNPGETPTETWETVDGGQGTAGKYKYLGKVKTLNKQGQETEKDSFQLTQTGAEKIDKATRVYHPETNLITGEKNQPGGERTLLGWIDVDKLEAQENKP